jgi:DNA polymerase
VSRRALILRELGLVPLWVRRDRFGAGPSAPERPTPSVQAQEEPDTELAPPPGAARPADDRAGRIAGLSWAELRASMQTCTACGLHKARKQAVPGVGDEQADWLFVGEGPGAEEDARGEPFVGPAGRLLDNMLASIGLKRGADVYIANVVKCRPPSNRVPEPAEAAACEPYLLRQIALIQPRLIVALGKTAACSLLRTEGTLASLRGRVRTFQGVPLLVTYHPAYLLRNPLDKARSWEDLCQARELMTRLKAGESVLT